MSSTPTPQVDPANLNDVTSYLASEAHWSATNLPEIFGRLDPPPGWSTAPKPQQLVENGRKVFRDKKAILDYDIPRYIASPGELESWRIEAWLRTHRGLSYDDIWARQPSWVPKPTNTQKNALNQRRLREVRKLLNARAWVPNSRCPGVSKVMLETVERLTQNEIDQNTNWTVVLGGIQQPNNPARVLPLGTFLTNGQTHTPSNEVSDARLELQRLRVLAGSNGIGHWSDLPDTLHPKTWSMRVKPRSIPMLVPIPGMEESTREEKPMASNADSKNSDGDGDKSDLASAHNDHETLGHKGPVVTDPDEEVGVDDAPVSTALNAAENTAHDVARVFGKGKAVFHQAETHVDNTRVHLTPANLLQQYRHPQPGLSSYKRQSSKTPITSSLAIAGINNQGVQSSRGTRPTPLQQSHQSIPEVLTQVTDSQAEAGTSKMNNEEYMNEVLERQDERHRLDAEAEQLGQDWDQLMAIPGIPADGPSTSAPSRVMPVPNIVAAFNIPADSEVITAPYDPEALGPLPVLSPVSVLAGLHDPEAAAPVSTPSRVSKRAKTVAVGLNESDRQPQTANLAEASTQHEPDLQDDFTTDDVPYGHGRPTVLDESSKPEVNENAAEPTAEPQTAAAGTQANAGKGKKRARAEFELDLRPEPTALELDNSKRRFTDAATLTTIEPEEAVAAAEVKQDGKVEARET